MLKLTSSAFWRQVQPAGAVSDFVQVFRGAGRGRWWVAALAAGTTYMVFSLVTHDEARVIPKPPTIVYITTLPEGRSDAEILAEDIANQKRQDRLAAEQAKRDAEVKGIYKAIGRASGFDVEKMDRDGEADAAADAKAAAAKQAALYGAGHGDSSGK